jgi:hypothetical protein
MHPDIEIVIQLSSYCDDGLRPYTYRTLMYV